MMILYRSFVLVVAVASSCVATAATVNDEDSAASIWPTIDFRPLLLQQDDTNKQQDIASSPSMDTVVEMVATALSSRGFFFAETGKSLDDVYAASRLAHALPTSIKAELAGHGYTGTDVNVTELSYEPNKRSTVAAFDYAKVHNTFVDTDTLKTPECLQDIASDLYDWQANFGTLLFRIFARALSLPEHTFAQHAESELGTLRLLRYPAVMNVTMNNEASSGNLIGISAHTDFEAFTTMHQTTTGLQVRARNSNLWETVPLVPDAILVIVGDVMERWTNGHWQATPHRVLPTDTERYAIIRFHAVTGATIIEPLPEFVSEENPAKYSRTTMEEIMRVITTNLQEGKGAWDAENDRSATADYDYRTCSNADTPCVK